MIVLDTNIISEASKPLPDPNVEAWLGRQALGDLFLCGPTIMELSYGAERYFLRVGSDRYRRVLEEMVASQFRNRVLAFDGHVPQRAGALRAKRERAGRSISIGDAMIAAVCLHHGATLATRNVRDFEGLDLELVNPFEAGS